MKDVDALLSLVDGTARAMGEPPLPELCRYRGAVRFLAVLNLGSQSNLGENPVRK